MKSIKSVKAAAMKIHKKCPVLGPFGMAAFMQQIDRMDPATQAEFVATSTAGQIRQSMVAFLASGHVG